MSDVRIEPFAAPFSAALAPPGSKSLTNRALVLAALADGTSALSNVLFADDTMVMLESLGKLGFSLEIDRTSRTVRVEGRGGAIPATTAELFCGNSGTSIRFLTALCTLGRGEFQLDGIARMRQRPIGDLVHLLKNLAGRIDYRAVEGFPPVTVHGRGLAGGIVGFGRSQSSQFLSALLQVAPYARREVQIDLEPRQTSWPYVAMTMRLMDLFGVTPELIRDEQTHEPQRIIVSPGKYAGTVYPIEPDASNASYFLAAAAIRPGAKITLNGLGKGSLQGDVGFADVLHQMGAGLVFGKDFISITGPEMLTGIDIDLSTMPDTAQTLGVVALFAEGPTRIRGLHTLRVKETDRVAAMAAELTKLGAEIDVEEDELIVNPPEDGKLTPAAIDTYDDHRMAMSFAVAGTRAVGVTINDAECVNKTYPEFFADLETLRSKQ